MGWILSKFRRKRSTFEELEKLEVELNSLGKLKTETLVWQKKVLGHLVTYSILAYLAAALLVYFRLLPSARSKQDQAVLLLPFLVMPLLIYILRRFLTWWYHRKVAKGDSKLAALKEKKTRILEDVMENETYKVAKQILDKFAPSKMQNQLTPPRPAGQGVPRPGTVGSGGMDLRRRPAPSALNSSAPVGTGTPLTRPTSTPTSAPSRPGVGPVLGGPGVMARAGGPLPGPPTGQGVLGPQGAVAVGRGAPGPPLPRPVLPRERGYLDKFVEYLVGDGPTNRFALICRQCQSHNGMALREEFEYVAYRCCYCYYWNPARKQRPVAPRLPDAATLPQSGGSSDDSDDSSSPPSRRGSFSRVSEKSEVEREVSEAEGARGDVSEAEEPEKKEASLAVEETSEEEVDTEAVAKETKAEAELVKDATEVTGIPVDGESEAKAVDIIDVALVKDVMAGDIKVDDEALGADWGLVIDRGGGEASTDGEPMEGVKEGGNDGSASGELAAS